MCGWESADASRETKYAGYPVEGVNLSRVFVKAERNLDCSSNTILKIGDLNS